MNLFRRILFISIILVLINCKKNKSDWIIGKWQIYDCEINPFSHGSMCTDTLRINSVFEFKSNEKLKIYPYKNGLSDCLNEQAYKLKSDSIIEFLDYDYYYSYNIHKISDDSIYFISHNTPNPVVMNIEYDPNQHDEFVDNFNKILENGYKIYLKRIK
ncbi:hypothetical protein [Moheibacter lacus]|uniref:Lipocalin-like domain-containing protein n=1 Tax=Moheibacter lacus TaxID=2745851 RepID=A0A838ZRP7_9FLAO|nr:hypothetical protein [Moheibacter lacus]MBA5629422.1 hypothetical protein [Moheibacter lacus]